jgi:hypothetical protein
MFSQSELELYDKHKCQADQLVEAAIMQPFNQSKNDINSLRWLNTLRLICNHGLMHNRKQESEMFSPGPDFPWELDDVQMAFEEQQDSGAAGRRPIGDQTITFGEGSKSVKARIEMGDYEIPSKIKALILSLQRYASKEKW